MSKRSTGSTAQVLGSPPFSQSAGLGMSRRETSAHQQSPMDNFSPVPLLDGYRSQKKARAEENSYTLISKSGGIGWVKTYLQINGSFG